ncbi:branched-chain amino acid ABC transporter ATP-binding protein/permease [Variovorax sp. PBL-E5]|uniref:branched-chain amino acid ABC transporter ATP-binding protein/permease n=1 Tax=Variovorax sp. PBL-E5 TaxID=434014 RepID=UPI0013180410|nr:ATP-binding cassette domain-containing protein [Variovorax sp. PBL-E5]VTU19245.1 Lipopolysaccharide export system ATP-binding protein LptB [Variovorax sp. PBL-E5]
MDSSDAVERTGLAISAGPALKPWIGTFALALGLIAVPLVADNFVAYEIALFLIYGIATQGVALCWGQCGFLPLGHALFFGLGAYLAGGILKAAEQGSAWLALLPIAVLLPAALAWLIAHLVFVRNARSGPFFSLITLAATMLGFLAAQQWSAVTGGFNGLSGIPELPGTERFTTLYWVIAAVAVASTAGLTLLMRRPIGVLWRAIAQNEDRLQFFGFATHRWKAGAFALSAALAALAGLLFAAHQGIVTPLATDYVLATQFVIWAAVGGKASPLGALLGAVIVGYASSELRDHFSAWEVIVGIAFMGVVRFLPNGVAGWFERWRRAEAAPHAVPAPAAPLRGLPSLVFEEVATGHAGVTILDGLTLALQGPGIRCVIGPNGAGKTSSFNVMTGRLPVRGGRIHLHGEDISGWPAWRVARRAVGRKFQIPAVFAELSVRQNLAIALWAERLGGWQAFARAPLGWHSPMEDEMLGLFPMLQRQLDLPAGRLAQGDRQALEFVMTVLPEPRLLLLDEPCAGLSPAETRRMIDAIKVAARRLDAAALVIEHDMSAVAVIAGHVYVLHQGRLLAEGSLAEVQADARVRAVYAGGSK